MKVALTVCAVVLAVAGAVTLITMFPVYEPQITAAISVVALALEVTRALNERSERK